MTTFMKLERKAYIVASAGRVRVKCLSNGKLLMPVYHYAHAPTTGTSLSE